MTSSTTMIQTVVDYFNKSDLPRLASDLASNPTLDGLKRAFVHPCCYAHITGSDPAQHAAFFQTFEDEMDGLGFDAVDALVEALMSGTPGGESYVGGAFLKAERAAKEAKIAVKAEDYVCYVQNLGSHCADLRTETRTFRAACCPGMPVVTIEIVQKGDEVDVWDQCHRIHDDGRREWLGNRCGAIQHYAAVAAEAMARLTVEG